MGLLQKRLVQLNKTKTTPYIHNLKMKEKGGSDLGFKGPLISFWFRASRMFKSRKFRSMLLIFRFKHKFKSVCKKYRHFIFQYRVNMDKYKMNTSITSNGKMTGILYTSKIIATTSVNVTYSKATFAQIKSKRWIVAILQTKIIATATR